MNIWLCGLWTNKLGDRFGFRRWFGGMYRKMSKKCSKNA